jgi:divalent metal cation (Fe/Co/Zn/Cd) transporter
VRSIALQAPLDLGHGLPGLAAASAIGFVGNEAVALFRIKVGREIGSAALVADGHHARVDGLTSLAVLGGVAGVWLGYPLADPLVGLVITAILDAAEHAAQRVPGVLEVTRTRPAGR